MSASEQAIPIAKEKTKPRFHKRAGIRTICLLAPLLITIGAVRFERNYPGFTGGMFNQMRNGAVRENRNLWFCISYWLEYMQMLKLNEDGIYGFGGVDETALDDFERGKLAYHRGNFAQAIKLIERDVSDRGESESKLFWLAICYLRHAEAENCLAGLIGDGDQSDGEAAHEHNSTADHTQLCSLPLVRVHDRADSARAAARLFEKLLDRYDSGNRLYQWLLNFNYMTAGGYPRDVPAKYLIRSDFIDSFYGERKRQTETEHAWLSFTDRARDLGVATFNTGRGVAVEDFNRDGWLDIITGGNFEAVIYYQNDQGRKFAEHTKEAGLGGIKQPFAITAADYDNDGWVDVFFGRPFGSYALYRNN